EVRAASSVALPGETRTGRGGAEAGAAAAAAVSTVIRAGVQGWPAATATLGRNAAEAAVLAVATAMAVRHLWIGDEAAEAARADRHSHIARDRHPVGDDETTSATAAASDDVRCPVDRGATATATAN